MHLAAWCDVGREGDPDAPQGVIQCTPCEIGSYKEVQGDEDCTNCPDDQLTPDIGSGNASDCTGEAIVLCTSL